ncbi:hypothetical protein GCM10010170_078340 [Dactylosporangium salmoneum]|uniref:Uncharacterized protein n=1 Tax=Dactylosporangium salmoneum TaxID=53361 RepID=A0ABN3HDA8_9ACTN
MGIAGIYGRTEVSRDVPDSVEELEQRIESLPAVVRQAPVTAVRIAIGTARRDLAAAVRQLLPADCRMTADTAKRPQDDALPALLEQYLQQLIELGNDGQVAVNVWEDHERIELFERAMRHIGAKPVVSATGCMAPDGSRIHNAGVLLVLPAADPLIPAELLGRLEAGATGTIGALAAILAREFSGLQLPDARPKWWQPVCERLLMPLPTNKAQQSRSDPRPAAARRGNCHEDRGPGRPHHRCPRRVGIRRITPNRTWFTRRSPTCAAAGAPGPFGSASHHRPAPHSPPSTGYGDHETAPSVTADRHAVASLTPLISHGARRREYV